MQETERAELLLRISEDRFLAHQVLFEGRHENETPWAHKEILDAVHGPQPRQLVEGFRGLGKTTLLEETAIVRACFEEFRHMVILGSSYTRACDRLEAIKNEFVVNDQIAELFGPQKKGKNAWQEGKIVLANGVCLQALGRDQAMTGIKYLNDRPDAALVDDVEDPEEVRTDLEREGTWRWFMRTFLPSLKHPLYTWVRVLGTRRGRGSLPERLEKDGWPTLKIPLTYINEKGEQCASWPGKFPLAVCRQLEYQYRGDRHTFMQEYMCETSSEQDRVFTRDMIRVVPQVRTWEAVLAMYDPARSTERQSATTGMVACSWKRHKLVIWRAQALKVMPDALIADIFRTQEDFQPIWIGVEETGLEEWLRQPLRIEMAKRGMLLPLKPLRAPKARYQFIEMMQPYFQAGEVEFAEEMPDAVDQLLGFRVGGPIDIPNALAYMWPLRPGAPVFDNFAVEHVADTLLFDKSKPLWLACNATRGLVAMALLQSFAGMIRVIADLVMEGDPAEVVPLMVRELSMQARMTMTATCPPEHYERYTNVGLVQALQKIPLQAERGGVPDRGRDALRRELGRLVRGLPAVLVSHSAPRVLNAFAGGYSFSQSARGQGETEPGLYRVMMEGIESCLSAMEYQSEIDASANWAYTNDGRRYLRYGRGGT